MVREQADLLVLPDSIVTVSDVTRLRLELEKLMEYLVQAQLRQAGEAITVPRVSKRLDELSRLAGVTLLKDADCRALLSKLELVVKTAPHIHLSFATDPSDEFLGHITKWFRTEIDPHILLSFGLQPSIAAGFIMRTPSHYYDCSLRKKFDENKHQLGDALKRERATV